MHAEDGVFGETEIQQQAAAVPVLRHMSDAEFLSPAGVSSRNIVTLKNNIAGDV